jgi:hypothetical protein
MAIEIVDFPINSMVILHSYVKLPEGNSHPIESRWLQIGEFMIVYAPRAIHIFHALVAEKKGCSGWNIDARC